MAVCLWGEKAPGRRRHLLSRQEERALAWRAYEGDTQAREQLILANRRLVAWVASWSRIRGLASHPDLIGWGTIGLIQAVDAYDPAWLMRFSTYAVPRIRNAIWRGWLDGGRLIRLPARTRSLSDETRHLRRAATRFEPLSLDLACSSVGPARAPDPLEISSDRDLSEFLRARIDEALRFLSPRTAQIIRCRFELDGPGPRTLQAIGDELGVTRELVRQIECRALRKLSFRLSSSYHLVD